MDEHQDKPYFKIGEVCELTGTQPYVLRFWESEFPTLAPEKNRSGQRIYRKRDIDLIQRIKSLLYEKEYTIAGARKVLEGEIPGDGHTDGSDSDADWPQEPSYEAMARKSEHDARGHERSHAESKGDPGRRGSPELPFAASRGSDPQFEAEVKNLRAKLARAEAELKSILAAMDRHDES